MNILQLHPQTSDCKSQPQNEYRKLLPGKQHHNPDCTSLARCLTAKQNGGIRNHRREASGVLCGTRIRRLTPRECLRLQGWQDDRIDRILAVTSEAQAYKQAGNGVTVNVVEAIGRRLAAVDAELNGETTVVLNGETTVAP